MALKSCYVAAKLKLEYSLEAQTILQGVAKKAQETAHSRIAAIVSKCLSAVFDTPYEFQILFERKRGKTEARLLLKRGNLVLTDPVDEAGGGVIDLCSFALRLAALLMSQPPARRVVVLDEPFKHFSEEYPTRGKAMLEALSKQMGIQFILSTHCQDLTCGAVIQVNP